MSAYVTWEICLRCGLLAAVGWVPVVGTSSAPAQSRPAEFDCRAGCQVGLDELAQAYGSPGYRASPGGSGWPGSPSRHESGSACALYRRTNDERRAT